MASQTSNTTPQTLVDTVVSLQDFLRNFNTQIQDKHFDQKNPILPRLYLHLEGPDLSRNGSISLLTLLVHWNAAPDLDRVYIFDIHTLREAAFTTSVKSTQYSAYISDTLKGILESKPLEKVVFEIGNANYALDFHFKVCLQRVIDLQLMDHASRSLELSGAQKALGDLSECVKRSSMSVQEKESWAGTEEKGAKVFLPEKGGKV